MVSETSNADTATPPDKTDGNAVFVGTKGVTNYVMAIMAQSDTDAGDVFVKARGHAISRAVDAVEVTRNRYITDIMVAGIKIGTDEVKGKRDDMIGISWIELFLSRT